MTTPGPITGGQQTYISNYADVTSVNTIYQLLSTNGDGTGTVSAKGNYASAAEEFYIEAPAGVTYDLYPIGS